MFSGIIKAVGEVKTYDESSHILRVASPMFTDEPSMGASVAIDGVCLTVSHAYPSAQGFDLGFDLGSETRRLTLLAKKKPHDLVNIEHALKLGDPIDGHMVQGHVEAIAKIISIEPAANGLLISISLPEPLRPFIVAKGSIAINGVSLTINHVDKDYFSLCLVPYTVDNTSFRAVRPGCMVHIETDIVGRYIYNFAEHRLSAHA